jgi:hypothetical protein
MPVGLLRHRFTPSGYSGTYGGRWRFPHADAKVCDMTVKDLISLAAVIVGMLLVLVAN